MRRHLSTVSKHVPRSGVYPLGFLVASTTAGLKKTTAPDMALVVSDRDCAGAAVFTRNAFAAAPVLVGREVIKTSGDAMRAVLVNAGCANACTGAQGIADTRTAIAKTAASLGLKSTGSTLMLSTGVIGVPLKMDRIEKGIDTLSASVTKSSTASHEDWLAAATAIMTTDTFPKLRSKEFSVNGKAYRIAGWSKGAGMIHPNMATMLAGIFTDAA
ncbi:hypothetical protein HDU77_008616, partial [Chytriomyces hyalinus]